MAPPNPPAPEPLDTSALSPATTDTTTPTPTVESPSVNSPNALARFEFAPQNGSKAGTKVLLIEWHEDPPSSAVQEPWTIAWAPSTRHVIPVREAVGIEAAHHRVYILLAASTPVPGSVSLRKGAAVHWRAQPLPAIFPVESGQKTAGKGVLHTLWAKKRLEVLDGEIEKESKERFEGIGLEMAVSEREAIRQAFGLGGAGLDERMEALKVQEGKADTKGQDALTPEPGDVALGSYNPATTAPTPSPSPGQPLSQPSPIRADPTKPAKSSPLSMESLSALATAPPPTTAPPVSNTAAIADVGFAPVAASGCAEDTDDLFALPMSPRSPEMDKSPFSFDRGDVEKYLRKAGGGAR